jgi:hypothetical protein
LLFANEPLPLLVHVPVFVDPVTVADRASVFEVVHNVTLFGEMLTVACLNTAVDVVAFCAAHRPFPVEVRLKITEPLNISALESV